MSLVELARQRARNPLSHEEVRKEQEQINQLVRQFCAGEINLRKLREGLFALQGLRETSSVVLNYGGPLYGLLRRLGLDKETARLLADEERAHLQAAERAGLTPRIIFEFSQCPDEEGILKQFLNIFVSYQIPEEIGEEQLRQAIREISLAPQEPSEDDLAKLPTQGIIFS